MIKFSIRVSLCYLFMIGQVFAQTTAAILPQGVTQFFDNNGNPLSSGKVYFYIPNTTTFKTTWQDSAKSIANPNPVILDAAGRAKIYGDGTYRQQVRSSVDNLIWDAVTASAGSGGGTTGTGDGDLVGTIKPWGGLQAPNQYVFAYGQELSRTTYAVLFAAVTSQQNITCSAGSPIATGFSDTTQIPFGAIIESICFAPGTTVLSKTSTTITFNSNSSVNSVDTARLFLYGNGNGSTTFNLPDLRGQTLIGRCNMGGTNCAVMPTVAFGQSPVGPNATGAKGGIDRQTITTANLPPYTPSGTLNLVGATGSLSGTINASITDPGHTHTVPKGGTVVPTTPDGGAGNYVNDNGQITGSSTTGISATVNLASGGVFTPTPHNHTFTGTPQGGTNALMSIVQPSYTVNYIIKITPDSNSADASGVTSLGGMVGDIACGAGLLCTGNIISFVGAISQGIAFPTRVAAIAATISPGTPFVLLEGYNAAGDAGQNAVYAPSSCPASVPSKFQSADGQCWQLSVPVPTAGMFGADNTGVVNSTTALQNFIDFIYTNDICGKITVGTYRHSGLSRAGNGNSLCIYGEATRTTTLKTTSTTTSDLILDTTLAGMNNVRISNLTFDSFNVKTAGYAIEQIGDTGLTGGLTNFSDLTMNGNTWGGIKLTSGQDMLLKRITIHNVGQNARGLSLVGSACGGFPCVGSVGGFLEDIVIKNGVTGGGGGVTTGVYIGDYSGWHGTNVAAQGGPTFLDYGIWIATTSSDYTISNYIRFVNSYADATAKAPIRIDGGTDVEFANGGAQFSGNGFSNIEINGGARITITGNTIRGGQQYGIRVNGGDSVIISDNQIFNNGFQGGGTNNYDDVIVAAGVSNFKIHNNNFCTSTDPVPAVRYNINVAAGASNNYTITNNNTNCNISGGVTDAGTGTSKNVSGNIGGTWTQYTPTVTCGAGTPTTITAVGRYQMRANSVDISINFTATNIGTCTTTLRASLPRNSIATGNVMRALNTTTLVGKNAITSGGNARVDVFADGGVFPVANGEALTVTGMYEVQ